jgi:lipopolysaccharide heptosyltransferase II
MNAVTERRVAWEHARNILCVRLDTIGDVLMTTPAIRALRQQAPGRRITLLTSQAGAAVAPLVPEIDDVVTYAAPWMKSTACDAIDEQAMAAELRARDFDAAVIFTTFTQSALPAAMLCRISGVPLRLAHCRENPYALLTDWVRDPEPDQGIRHEVRRQLDLVRTVGASLDDERLSLRVPESARLRALFWLDYLGIDLDAPWAILHPGATAPSRRYPGESYGRAARSLCERGWRIVLTGSGDETELARSIAGAAGPGACSLAGRVDLSELSALIEMAPLLISNNTGPVHIAAAVGTPVVDLYALTNPQHTPWMTPHRVLSHDVPCRNCFASACPRQHNDCLRLIDPEDVMHAALELAAETARVRPVAV